MAISGAAAVALVPDALTAQRERVRPREGASAAPFTLGIATYSLREFGREEAIQMLKQLRVTSVSVKSFHLPYDDSAGQLAAGAEEFLAAGIEPVSCGLVTFEEDSDEHVQKYFDYAKSAGIPMIVMTAAPEILPRIERFVKAYDIPVAIHNHGPEDPFYPAPSAALSSSRLRVPERDCSTYTSRIWPTCQTRRARCRSVRATCPSPRYLNSLPRWITAET